MFQKTISLKDEELKALKKICQIKNISLHQAIKMAIQSFIKSFQTDERHHRMPNGKLVENCV